MDKKISQPKMTTPILIYHHGVFVIGGQALPSAEPIAREQMQAFESSGLLDAASEFHVCINGGAESVPIVNSIFPAKAQVVYHGPECRSENLTVVQLCDRAKQIEGEAYILYEHQKGSSHAPGTTYGENVAKPWRIAMTHDLVTNWRQCVADLDAGHDIACMVWLWDMGWDKSQHIPAGNWLWVRASFVRKLPSIYDRARIREDGIGALSSRYEAEVFWGNGPRPNVKAYRTALPF